MIGKILNIFNKEKTMEDSKVDQEVVVEKAEVKEEVKKETKKQGTSWFMNNDAK